MGNVLVYGPGRNPLNLKKKRNKKLTTLKFRASRVTRNKLFYLFKPNIRIQSFTSMYMQKIGSHLFKISLVGYLFTTLFEGIAGTHIPSNIVNLVCFVIVSGENMVN